MKFSLEGGAAVGPGQYSGEGWKLDPGQVRAVLSGLDEELDPLCRDAARLGHAVTDMAAPPTLQSVTRPTPSGPPVLDRVVADYHGLPEWGLPFGGAVVAALDEALYTQTTKINQVVGAICAAVVGVSQATAAYEAGAEEMLATIQTAAAESARTGDFSYFDYLREP